MVGGALSVITNCSVIRKVSMFDCDELVDIELCICNTITDLEVMYKDKISFRHGEKEWYTKSLKHYQKLLEKVRKM